MNKTEELNTYCIQNSSEEAQYLRELRRETHLKTLRPQMLSGPLQGQLLKMLVQLFKPKNILEIGTFTGYATLCMASGLGLGAKIYTLELEEEYAYFHHKYFVLSGLSEHIECIYGDANAFVENTDLAFDFVFMDAGKKDYQSQFDLLLNKMNSGGMILADNVLWKGRVLEEKKDKMTSQIDEFNAYVQQHEAVENVILPIRDGINLIRVL
ncbi:O-methyltransferase [Portibacter marinus]|uniref:O-methyltransferase n=1 Tax=Portibacter marinus TaxID=2898660 RepID=UPI001F1DC3EE|nr:O-methyltransferase [Portibacter marinus]